MRSPIITFSIVAAAAVSPALVSAAPNLNTIAMVPQLTSNTHSGSSSGSPRDHHAEQNREPFRNAQGRVRRADDGQTAGGNAYTGNSNDVYGGDVVNKSNSDTTAQTNAGGSE